MDALGAHRQHIEDAWNHAWESLETVLRAITDEEAEFQDPAYAQEPEEGGWPMPGSIRWQVAHVAHCKRYYALLLRNRGTKERPSGGRRTPTTDIAADIAELAASQADLLAALDEIQADELTGSVPTGMAIPEFLSMITRHDAWHGGQIAMARRLYRARHLDR
jgi:uncharacterized damage-inducible protein DinB